MVLRLRGMHACLGSILVGGTDHLEQVTCGPQFASSKHPSLCLWPREVVERRRTGRPRQDGGRRDLPRLYRLFGLRVLFVLHFKLSRKYLTLGVVERIMNGIEDQLLDISSRSKMRFRGLEEV